MGKAKRVAAAPAMKAMKAKRVAAAPAMKAKRVAAAAPAMKAMKAKRVAAAPAMKAMKARGVAGCASGSCVVHACQPISLLVTGRRCSLGAVGPNHPPSLEGALRRHRLARGDSADLVNWGETQ